MTTGLQQTRRRALQLAVGLLAIGAGLTTVIAVSPEDPVVQGLDDAWNRWMVDHRSGVAIAIAIALSFIGSAWVAWPVRAVAAWVLVRRRRHVQLAAFAVANVVAQVAIGPMKAVIGRPRPLDPLVATRSAAFPSGHAIAAAVTAFGLVAAFVPRGPGRVRWTAGAAVFAASMALARTYLSAHWLTDTIAGVAFGVGLALGTEALFEPAASAEEEWEDQTDARDRDRPHPAAARRGVARHRVRRGSRPAAGRT